MKVTTEKVQFFENILKDFFRVSGREELPWRKKGITPYEVWVSEIMLQQTQVSRVIGYYQRFLKKFPTVEKLAKTSWEEFVPYYEGLGYYARGRNMLKAAQTVVSEHGGKFPRNVAVLQEIPGIGPYTAAAIMSFAYGDKHLAWDTNLRRVVGRVFSGSKNASIDTEKLEHLFTLPRKTLNAAIMDFGSSICTARPKCGNCPLAPQCLYFKTKGRKEEKAVKEKDTFPTAEAQVILFLHENHKKYYSSRKKKFAPFVLPSAYNTRAAIKEFFLKQYGLQLAVRPVHKKLFFQGKPTLLINAQILTGKPIFTTFSKQAVAEYTKDNF
jgi:A/G-specific adenine glycosylase